MSWYSSDRAARLPSNWSAIRRRILARDHHTCQIHGRRCTRTATEVDHITRDAGDGDSNLQSVCANCHKAKTQGEAQAARRARHASRYRSNPKHPGLRSDDG